MSASKPAGSTQPGTRSDAFSSARAAASIGHGERLDGQTVLITGASRGIGAVIAQVFAERGARLALVSRTAEDVSRVAQEIAGRGTEAVALTGDVSQRNAVEQIVAATLKAFGRIDVLINAAGIYGPIGPFVGNDLDHWAAAIGTNLLGTVYMTHAVLPQMIVNRKGVIINFSGGGAVQPFPRFSAYGTSKAAVVRFTETIAQEVADSGVRVNAIAPGPVNTRLLDAVLSAGEAAGAEFYAKAVAQKSNGGTPPGRAAELALFLACASGAGISGRLLSAIWDDWKDLPGAGDTLSKSSLFTLRRIDGRHFCEMS